MDCVCIYTHVQIYTYSIQFMKICMNSMFVCVLYVFFVSLLWQCFGKKEREGRETQRTQRNRRNRQAEMEKSKIFTEPANGSLT